MIYDNCELRLMTYIEVCDSTNIIGCNMTT